MNSNKGFSLVEMIIVISIMAVLVALCAPKLLVYYEKTFVVSDVQACDTLRTAIKAFRSDSLVLKDTNYRDPASLPTSTYTSIASLCSATNSTYPEKVMKGITGCPNSKTLDIYMLDQLKSANSNNTNYVIEFNGDEILIYLPGTDMSGQKNSSLMLPSSTGSSCIYAGNIKQFGY